VEQPIVMEDNSPPHKKVCIPIRQELGMKCHQHPPNSPDLNPIENIWAHMKHIISKEYTHITFQKVMRQVVVSIWNDFENHRWDHSQIAFVSSDKMREGSPSTIDPSASPISPS
jgi:transposase